MTVLLTKLSVKSIEIAAIFFFLFVMGFKSILLVFLFSLFYINFSCNLSCELLCELFSLDLFGNNFSAF